MLSSGSEIAKMKHLFFIFQFLYFSSCENATHHGINSSSISKLLSRFKATEGVIDNGDNGDDEYIYMERLLYGATYYPWRSTNKNCSELSEREIDEDFMVISTIADNVQIFDLYCNLTPVIVELSRQYGMGLMLGVATNDPTDYERQKNELITLLDGDIDLSRILAITVGRTSMLETTPDEFLSRLKEIELLVNTSRLNITVTTIADVHVISDKKIPESIGRYPVVSPKFAFKVFEIGNSDPRIEPQDFFVELVGGWIDEADLVKEKKETDKSYTEFGYPFVCYNGEKEDKDYHNISKDFSNDSSDPEDNVISRCHKCIVQAFIYLSCVNVFKRRTSAWKLRTAWPRRDVFNRTFNVSDKIMRYFYHSAFDLPFLYPNDDPRSKMGLADFKTRRLKLPLVLLKLVAADGMDCNGYEDQCAQSGIMLNTPVQYHISKSLIREKNRSFAYEWIVTGFSLSLASISAFTLAFVCFCYGRQKADKPFSFYSENSDNVTENWANCLIGDYINFVSPADHKNICAMVKSERLIDEKALQYMEILGEGYFGIVQRAKFHCADKDMEVAAKKLHIGAENIKQFLSEITAHEEFCHPNILPLIGVSFTSYHLPIAVSPFMEKGDLLSHVKINKNFLTVRQLLNFSLEIAQGVSYLHDIKIIHRNLAARNCMLDEMLSVKVADFGIYRGMNNSDFYETIRASDLPIRWMAPETLANFEFIYPSDTWSYGITLWELFSHGQQLYETVPLAELRTFLRDGHRLDKPRGCPLIIYDLIKNCWHSEVEKRPDFQQLRQNILSIFDSLEETQMLDVKKYYNILA